MRLLIVDDERPARDRLRRLLAQEAASAGIEAIDEAADGFAALARIEACRPDAIFLDIAMPELSGIELAASLPDPAPLVVFLTAHDRYALQAFEVDAIDYLLKPCDGTRLRRALQRLQSRLQALHQGPDGSAPQMPAQSLPQLPERPLRRLLVSERGGTRVVRVADIGWIETADNYVALHTADGSPLLRQTLAGLLPRLGPGFVRCHRRAAVQVDRIERMIPSNKGRLRGDCELLLRDGARVPCSRQYREAVLALL